jgi:hypothetical protein
MKYQVTILLEAGTYEQVLMDVPVDIEQTWQHFLTNKQVRTALNEYNNYQVIDIDPQIDFKDLVDYNKSTDDDRVPIGGQDGSELLQLE